MLRPFVLVLALVLPVIAPVSAQEPFTRAEGSWGNSLDPEPNHWRDEPTLMWTEGPEAHGSRIYFDAIILTAGAADAGTAHTGSPSTLAQVYAYFGVWRDCNHDGYIGHGALGLLEYPAQLLSLGGPFICYPELGRTGVHNTGTMVYEMLWLRPDGPAGAGELEAPGSKVWADLSAFTAPADAGRPPLLRVDGEPVVPAPLDAIGWPPKSAPDLTLEFVSRTAGTTPRQMPAVGGLCGGCHGWVSPTFVLAAPHAAAAIAEPPYAAHAYLAQGPGADMTAYGYVGSIFGVQLPGGSGRYGTPQCGLDNTGTHHGWDCDPANWTGTVELYEYYRSRDADRIRYVDTETAYRWSGRDGDGDGIADEWASAWGVLDAASDLDADNASALTEFRWSTWPVHLPTNSLDRTRDHDDDGWLDGDEIRYWDADTEPLVTGLADDAAATAQFAMHDPDDQDLAADEDDLTNVHDEDSDGDGARDGYEVHEMRTYPEFRDSDCRADAKQCTPVQETRYGRGRVGAPGTGDGLNDSAELIMWTELLGAAGWLAHCDDDAIPNIMDGDSDNDGLRDGEEAASSACDPDTDDDELLDGEERAHATDPEDPDSDDDGMPDGWEVAHGLQPLVDDAGLSTDGDLLVNLREYELRADPRVPDTDLDLLLDHEEAAMGTDARAWDTDGDRMPDGWERRYQLDALRPDGHDDPDDDAADLDADGVPEYVHTNLFEYLAGRRPPSWNESASGPWLGGTDPRDPDTDGDGASDGAEVAVGENQRNPLPDPNQDADQDGLLAQDEILRRTGPEVSDTDGDGLCDGGGALACLHPCNAWGGRGGEVHQYGSSPLFADTDGDGWGDAGEVCWFDREGTGSTGDPDGDTAPSILDRDADGDGLEDAEEFLYGTSPSRADSDDDMLSDRDEVIASVDRGHSTNATNGDTDGDGLFDGAEWHVHHTLPDEADTDGDGLSDSYEIEISSTDPLLDDSDRDGMPDGWEVQYALEPLRNDAAEDPDRDGVVTGLTNYEEYVLGLHGGTSTHPRMPDTDLDGINDHWEVMLGLSPTNTNIHHDTDEDGLDDLGEFLLRADPHHPDSDRDGLTDAEEAGTNDPIALAARLTPSDPTLIDTDGDGLDDGRERALWGAAWMEDHDLDAPPALLGGWSNLRDADSDGDGFDDGQEWLVFRTRADAADTDGDGAGDAEEVLVLHTDPHRADSNARTRGPAADADADADGLSDAEEAQLGTDPRLPDTDADGSPDGAERAAWGPRLHVDFDGAGEPNNLLDDDSDADGTKDGIEFIASGLPRSGFYILDPGSPDTDADGLFDHQEGNNGLALPVPGDASQGVRGAFGLLLMPASQPEGARGVGRAGDTASAGDRSDTDADCLSDGMERDLGSDPTLPDTDGDRLDDCHERSAVAARAGAPVLGLPCGAGSYDADCDGWLDVSDPDDDSDGLSDADEQRPNGGTRSHDADTDDDGLCDGEESIHGASPTQPDSDKDGLGDGRELGRRGGCVTTYRSDWSHGGTLIADGRPALQDHLGATPPPADVDNDGQPAILDWDADGDLMLDGLEDWDADGIVDPGEGDPTRFDHDRDGVPDSVELQVYGKMTLATFLQEAARLTGVTTPEAARALATYDRTSAIKTDPTKKDTDGDGIPEGYDINPNGRTLPKVRIVLEKLAMLDAIDPCIPKKYCGDTGGFRLDPYFEFEVQTTLGSIYPMTENLAELPLNGPRDEISLVGLGMEAVGVLSDAGKKVSRLAGGVMEIQLTENVTTLPLRPNSAGNLEWDRVMIRIKLGDWDCHNSWGSDCGAEGNRLGRDPSDVVDITSGDDETTPVHVVSFRLTEFGGDLRGTDRHFPPSRLPDGGEDGHRTWSDSEDDGRLLFHVENAVKTDLLKRAFLVGHAQGAVPVPSGQAFGA